jgi:hypothetical protein
MSFFKKIPDDKWAAEYKKKAEEYDERGAEHALSGENLLTGDKLKKIIQAEKEIAPSKDPDDKPSIQKK